MNHMMKCSNTTRAQPKTLRAGPFWLIWVTYTCGIMVIVQVQYALLWAATQSEQVMDLINKLRSTEHVDKTTKVIAQHQQARVTKEVNNKNMMRLVKISGQGVAVCLLFERWVTGLINAYDDIEHNNVYVLMASVLVTIFAYLALYLARRCDSVATMHEPEESAQNADACDTQPMMNLPAAIDRVDETQETEPPATDQQL